jgi:hypothetical protein
MTAAPSPGLRMVFGRGTDGSNPAPSSAESRANFSLGERSQELRPTRPEVVGKWWIPGMWAGGGEELRPFRSQTASGQRLTDSPTSLIAAAPKRRSAQL